MKKSVSMCVGCRDNFYNGNNDLGVKQCWNFPKATVEQRMMIPIDMRPPYTFPTKTVLSCYSPPRVANVKPESLTTDGFWK